MTRSVTIAALLGLVAGCVSNPYVDRSVEDETGEVVEYRFAYGRFCGPGRPSLEYGDGEEKRTVDLASLWPPVDDIDAMCFAHDYCYVQNESNTMQCDVAFGFLLQDFLNDFPEPACYNLMHDLLYVFYPSKQSRSPWKFGNRFNQINDSIFGRAILEFTKKTDAFPAEGTCLFVNRLSAEMLFDAFEHYYTIWIQPYPAPSPLEISIPRTQIRGLEFESQ